MKRLDVRDADGLTLTQRKVINALSVPEFVSIRGALDRVHISQNTYYKWMHEDPAFREAVANCGRHYGEAHLMEAWASLIESIKNDRNPQSMRLYFDLLGYLQSKNINISGLPQTVIITGEDALED